MYQQLYVLWLIAATSAYSFAQQIKPTLEPPYSMAKFEKAINFTREIDSFIGDGLLIGNGWAKSARTRGCIAGKSYPMAFEESFDLARTNWLTLDIAKEKKPDIIADFNNPAMLKYFDGRQFSHIVFECPPCFVITHKNFLNQLANILSSDGIAVIKTGNACKTDEFLHSQTIFNVDKQGPTYTLTFK